VKVAVKQKQPSVKNSQHLSLLAVGVGEMCNKGGKNNKWL